MKNKKWFKYACDFETTVDDNTETQTHTEVWSACFCELFTENVMILGSIKSFMEYFISDKNNIMLYFHNLKFDGCFILSWLLKNNFKQALQNDNGNEYFKKDKEMKNNEFKYSISDRGQFYTIVIKVNNKFIEIRDSLKLIPFSLKEAGKSFKTKHKKLEMEYKGNHFENCVIKEDEKKYIENDVLVLKELLEAMFSDGHDKLTIGACCKAEYKNIFKISKKIFGEWDDYFPDMLVPLCKYKRNIDGKWKKEEIEETADNYCRKSYRGGWCYVVKGKENKVFGCGATADVNSLYPSMMLSDSGNKYPIGKPFFCAGNSKPPGMNDKNSYYFIRFTCRFNLKKGFLPFVQIKDSLLYRSTENLETSDIWSKKLNKYVKYYRDWNGEIKPCTVTLTMTQTDWKLFNKHYNISELTIHSKVYFYATIGLFDDYINKYAEIKKNSTGAKRTLAKLYLNNLYGKTATSDDSSFKVVFLKEDGSLGFRYVEQHEKATWYIPVGSAITSYARCFTIAAAQKNYYGENKPGFIYADTDSIHCNLKPEEFRGIKVHNTDFCCWKIEARWDSAIFVRQKTYIEKVVEEDLEPENFSGKKVENEKGYYYNVKCAGMTDAEKNLFIHSIENEITEKEKEEYSVFLYDKNNKKIYNTIEDFKVGLVLPLKLRPKQVDGGVVLEETTFMLR